MSISPEATGRMHENNWPYTLQKIGQVRQNWLSIDFAIEHKDQIKTQTMRLEVKIYCYYESQNETE